MSRLFINHFLPENRFFLRVQVLISSKLPNPTQLL